MLRFLLFIQAAVLIFYSVIVVANEGWDFVSVALQNTADFSWSGQFGLDFTCYLMLSGLWVAWRGKFTASSIALGLVVMLLGIIVFAPTVLYFLFQTDGDIQKMLLGKRIKTEA